MMYKGAEYVEVKFAGDFNEYQGMPAAAPAAAAPAAAAPGFFGRQMGHVTDAGRYIHNLDPRGRNAIYGGLGGAALGAGIGYLTAEDEDAAQAAMYGAMGGAALGGAAGAGSGYWQMPKKAGAADERGWVGRQYDSARDWTTDKAQALHNMNPYGRNAIYGGLGGAALGAGVGAYMADEDERGMGALYGAGAGAAAGAGIGQGVAWYMGRDGKPVQAPAQAPVQ